MLPSPSLQGLAPAPPYLKTPPNPLLPCWGGSWERSPHLPVSPHPHSSTATICCLSSLETFLELLLQGAEAGAGGGILAGVAVLGWGQLPEAGEQGALTFVHCSPREPLAPRPCRVFSRGAACGAGRGGEHRFCLVPCVPGGPCDTSAWGAAQGSLMVQRCWGVWGLGGCPSTMWGSALSVLGSP